MIKICDYSTSEFGRKCTTKEKATKLVRVKYNGREEDVLFLCGTCAQNLNLEALQQQWSLTMRDYGCSHSTNSISS